jgi:hypothetical protein
MKLTLKETAILGRLMAKAAQPEPPAPKPAAKKRPAKKPAPTSKPKRAAATKANAPKK